MGRISRLARSSPCNSEVSSLVLFHTNGEQKWRNRGKMAGRETCRLSTFGKTERAYCVLLHPRFDVALHKPSVLVHKTPNSPPAEGRRRRTLTSPSFLPHHTPPLPPSPLRRCVSNVEINLHRREGGRERRPKRATRKEHEGKNNSSARSQEYEMMVIEPKPAKQHRVSE